MRIAIRHVTRYSYDHAARSGVLTLRLTPPAFNGQSVPVWSIRAPGFDKSASFRDGYGNLAHLVTIGHEHTEVEIEAGGIVETVDRSGLVSGLPESTPVRVYLRETPATAPDQAIRDLAEAARTADPVTCLHGVMAGVHAAIAYVIGETDSQTTAADALERGRGVCQDHAHVFIAAVRALGMPARYVNGYMIADEGQSADAHHGWAEAWVEGVGWIGFDCANLICPTDRYVRLATGLDAASAAPIRGSRQGGEKQTLDVVVEVAQQGANQQ